jgi:hypothetical protein
MAKAITNSDIALRSLAHYIDKEINNVLLQSQTLGDDLCKHPNIKSNTEMKINYDKDGVAKQIKFAISINLSADPETDHEVE